jgi:ParB-like chromosome segregation protein Spo0J
VRRHGTKNIEAIKGSLARFGQQKPVVVGSNNVVIAGNGTIAAARELGWSTVRIVRSDLKGSDRTAYAIADNRSGELAEWDDAALTEQLSALAIEDLAATGFDESELAKMVDEMASFVPTDGIEQPRLDTKFITCPECGHEFAG